MRVGRALLHNFSAGMGFAPACAAGASAQPFPQQGEGTQQVMPVPDNLAKYQGLLVAEIRFPGVPSAAGQQRLRDLLPQKQGQPLERDSIRQSIHVLYDTGRFTDVSVEAEDVAGNQVRLSFVTTPNFFVGEVRVEGAPRVPPQARS